MIVNLGPFNLGDFVYLSEGGSDKYRIIGVLQSLDGSIEYKVRRGTTTEWFYPSELSIEEVIR